MPRLRTDDGPRKLRAVWLGPAGSTLPFQWTYVQWLVTLIAIPVGAIIGGALVGLTGAGWVWTLGIGVLWGGAAGVWAAVSLMGHVTYDEPLRYQRRLVRGEFSRRFATTKEIKPIEVSFAYPPIGYLSTPVRRAMGWDTPDQSPLDAGSTRADSSDRSPLHGGGRADNPDRSPLHGGGRADNPYLSIRPATTAPS